MAAASTSSTSTDQGSRPRHASHSETCGVCQENAGERNVPHGFLWEDDLWVLRHSAPPYGVAGWLTLQAKRHVAGPAFFSDDEAARLGPTLRRFCGLLQEVTGCLRVYVAAMGESHPHFHMHLVPRYGGEGAVAGWGLFLSAAEAAAGRITVDAAKVEAIIAALKEKL
jgi:diadenosine tetraphosphate (Ap4A) HIT family hydrolase